MRVPRRLYNALLSVMTMRRILATTAALCLGGCITVYGPVKTGGQQQQGSQTGQQPGMSEQISTSFIGNRKPDELLNAVALYFREKAITASVNDQTTGIIAGTPFPELINQQWLRRYDITVKIRRKVTRTYNIKSIVDGNVAISTGD